MMRHEPKSKSGYKRPSGKLKPVIAEIQPDVLGLQKPVSTEVALKIIGIARWDMNFLHHRFQKHDMNEKEIKRGILEVKRYHAIGVIDVTYVHAVSEPVDPFWHEHLHFSVDYQEFCKRFVGHYKEHFPLDEYLPGVREQIMPCYERTLEIYREYFGPADPVWWPEGMPVCVDVNHILGHYRNGWYEPLDWKKLLASKGGYDELLKFLD